MFSVNDLSTFVYCPRKLYLERVTNLKSGFNKSVMLGSIRQEVFDLINKSQQSIISRIEHPNKDSIEKILRENYSNIISRVLQSYKEDIKKNNLKVLGIYNRIWPFVLNELNYKTKSLLDFMLKTGFKDEELWINLEPKIETEKGLESQSLELKGVVDRLLLFKDKVIPVELKTGKTPDMGIWPSHKIQIIAYLMLVNKRFNLKMKKGIVKYLNTNTERTAVLNPFFEYKVERMIKKIRILFSEKKPPKMCSNTNKCKYCSMRKICYGIKG